MSTSPEYQALRAAVEAWGKTLNWPCEVDFSDYVATLHQEPAMGQPAEQVLVGRLVLEVKVTARTAVLRARG